jgi:tetratricopeptide (TPR) repeat protein
MVALADRDISPYVPVFRDSEALWNRVLAGNPASSMAHSSLGNYCFFQGRFEEAALHYDADLSERPFFEASLRGRALLHEAEGQPGEAKRLYGLLLESCPRSPGARVQYADFLERLGELPKGLEILLGLDPAHADGQYCQRLSDFLRLSGRPDEAHLWARRAVDTAPYDARSWHRLGIAENERGDFRRAEEALEKALLLDSGLELAREALAKLRDAERL